MIVETITSTGVYDYTNESSGTITIDANSQQITIYLAPSSGPWNIVFANGITYNAVSITGATSNLYMGSNPYLANGSTQTFVGPANSNVIYHPDNASRASGTPPISCLLDTSLVFTRNGLVRAIDLKPGDMVATLEHGYQPVRWTYKSLISFADASNDKHRPIRFDPSLKGGEDVAPLLVSPQHRVLVNAKSILGTGSRKEYFSPAKKLTRLEGVEVCDKVDAAVYVHVAFDAHEIVQADGWWVESYFAGRYAILSLPNQERSKLLEALNNTMQPLPWIKRIHLARPELKSRIDFASVDIASLKFGENGAARRYAKYTQIAGLSLGR